MQPGIFAPGSYPIRDPREQAMKVGRCANPPRYQKMGDLSGPGKWAGRYEFAIEAPTSVKPGRAVGERI